MEKTSLKLVFLFFLIVIALCDAREMAKEEVNCIGGKCPEGKNCSCLPLVEHIMKETNKLCDTDKDCLKYCPMECKPGTCVCACNFGCTCECY